MRPHQERISVASPQQTIPPLTLTGPLSTDLRPSDVIIERFAAWKAIVKQLIGTTGCLGTLFTFALELTFSSLVAYFEGVADIENNTARELTKLGGVI